MSEKSKIEMEELLSALVDDEATERQKNEYLRLVQHDPSIADQLAVMQRQKQLLAALPVESAPETLAEDVCAAIERKQILGDVPSAQPTIVGTSHLFMRRILTTAAMLLLPIGLLSFVVFEIIKPPSAGPVDYPPVGGRLAQNETTASDAPSIAKELPFDGTLTFRTQQPMTVSNYAEKMIFDQGLISSTVPNRTMDTVTYQITAPLEKIAVLMDSLEGVWPHCQQITLSVSGSPQDSRIEIPNVLTEQVKTLMLEDSGEMLNRLAGQYASANINKDSVFAKENIFAAPPIDVDDSLPLTIPILTGKNEPAANTIDPSQPTIRLRIQVERMTE
jgi:hypothetical protein